MHEDVEVVFGLLEVLKTDYVGVFETLEGFEFIFDTTDEVIGAVLTMYLVFGNYFASIDFVSCCAKVRFVGVAEATPTKQLVHDNDKSANLFVLLLHSNSKSV